MSLSKFFSSINSRLKGKSKFKLSLYLIAILIIAIFLIFFPKLVTTPYFIHIFVLAGMYIVLSLSYDLVVGHVGSLSLAHPAFFGIGAYAGALLAIKLGVPMGITLLAGAIMGAVLAILIGIPSFRLGGHSFAIGTLGFALAVEIIVRNWVKVTRGPMGIPGIPKPVLRFIGFFEWRLENLGDFYYLMLILVILTIVLYKLVDTSRVGRAFRAIREDEILASANAINPLANKMLAFTIGASIAGVAGVFYAYWFSLVSPEIFGMALTTTLLIIVFVGGRTSLRGIIVAALLVTVIPEFLRITPELRLVLYGLILLLTILFFPEGLEGIFQRVEKRK